MSHGELGILVAWLSVVWEVNDASGHGDALYIDTTSPARENGKAT